MPHSSAILSARRRTAWRNVAGLAHPPRVPKREIRPLAPQQAHQLIDASADDRLRALWVTALGTGLGQSELLGLRWEDVDLEAHRLRVRHTLARVDNSGGGLSAATAS